MRTKRYPQGWKYIQSISCLRYMAFPLYTWMCFLDNVFKDRQTERFFFGANGLEQDVLGYYNTTHR